MHPLIEQAIAQYMQINPMQIERQVTECALHEVSRGYSHAVGYLKRLDAGPSDISPNPYCTPSARAYFDAGMYKRPFGMCTYFAEYFQGLGYTLHMEAVYVTTA